MNNIVRFLTRWMTEKRAVVGVFGLLFFLSWMGGTGGRLVSVPERMPLHAVFGVGVSAYLLWQVFYLFCYLAVGVVAAWVIQNSWDFWRAQKFPWKFQKALEKNRLRVFVCAALVIHAALLWRDVARAPALYSPFWGDGAVALLSGWLLIAARWALLLGFAVVVGGAVAQRGLLASRWFWALTSRRRQAFVVLGSGALVFCAGVWGVSRYGPSQNTGPNVLVIGVDAFRADTLTAQKNGQPIAPALRALAAESTAFPNTVSPSLESAPAWMTFLTGQTPLVHGLRHTYSASAFFAPGPDALPAVLKKRGYALAVAAGAGSDFFARANIPWNERQGPTLPHGAGGDLLRRHAHLLPYARLLPDGWVPAFARWRELDAPRLVAERAGETLGHFRRVKTFFMAVHFTSLQPPLNVASPEAYRALAKGYHGPYRSAYAPAAAQQAPDPARHQEMYEVLARDVDQAVGRVLRSLQKTKLDKNTIVMFWSPYGQAFVKKRLDGLEAEVVAAPVFWRDPVSPLPPSVTADWVRAHDLAPTLLTALNVPVPEGTEGLALQNRDFSLPPDEFFAAYTESNSPWRDVPPVFPLPPLPALLRPDPAARNSVQVSPLYEDDVLMGKSRWIRLGSETLIYTPGRDGARFEYEDAAGPPRNAGDRARELKDILFRFMAREEGWRPQNDLWIPEGFLSQEPL